MKTTVHAIFLLIFSPLTQASTAFGNISEIINNLPNPVEFLFDPITHIVLGIYGILILWELISPRIELPKIKGWWFMGMISFICYFLLSSYLPMIWDGFFTQNLWFDLTGWPWLAQFFVGLMVFEFFLYGWHRLMHSNRTIWRIFHQMHHSSERIDAPGAFYFSLWDMIGFTLLGSLSLVYIIGLDASPTTAIILTTTFLAIFQHTNVKTPVWLGYIVQRPESHSLHHGKGVHYFNFSDIPLFDMLFGTFRNPYKGPKQTGFNNESSKQLIAMHLMKDLSRNDTYFFKQKL